MDKKGLNLVIVGGMGEGKSTYIKTMLARQNCKKYIYDPNEEYQEFKNFYPGLMRVKDFGAYVNAKSRFAINVFEEATAFLRHGAPSEDVIELMTRKRHYRVINIFVFHSMGAVPTYIFSYINYLILFKTTDREDIIKSRYKENPQVLEAFYKAKKNPKYKPAIQKMQ